MELGSRDTFSSPNRATGCNFIELALADLFAVTRTAESFDWRVVLHVEPAGCCAERTLPQNINPATSPIRRVAFPKTPVTRKPFRGSAGKEKIGPCINVFCSLARLQKRARVRALPIFRESLDRLARLDIGTVIGRFLRNRNVMGVVLPDRCR